MSQEFAINHKELQRQTKNFVSMLMKELLVGPDLIPLESYAKKHSVSTGEGFESVQRCLDEFLLQELLSLEEAARDSDQKRREKGLKLPQSNQNGCQIGDSLKLMLEDSQSQKSQTS